MRSSAFVSVLFYECAAVHRALYSYELCLLYTNNYCLSLHRAINHVQGQALCVFALSSAFLPRAVLLLGGVDACSVFTQTVNVLYCFCAVCAVALNRQYSVVKIRVSFLDDSHSVPNSAVELKHEPQVAKHKSCSKIKRAIRAEHSRIRC